MHLRVKIAQCSHRGVARFVVFTGVMPVQKPVQLPPKCPPKALHIVRRRPDSQLFTIRRLFRNQQVSGSIPEGGSKNQSPTDQFKRHHASYPTERRRRMGALPGACQVSAQDLHEFAAHSIVKALWAKLRPARSPRGRVHHASVRALAIQMDSRVVFRKGLTDSLR